MKGFLRDNGLSLVLIALFVVFFIGQAVFKMGAASYGWGIPGAWRQLSKARAAIR